MIFELADTWREGIVILLIGFLMIFTSEYIRYKRNGNTYISRFNLR